MTMRVASLIACAAWGLFCGTFLRGSYFHPFLLVSGCLLISWFAIWLDRRQ